MTTALQYADITITANKSDVKHDTQKIWPRIWGERPLSLLVSCQLHQLSFNIGVRNKASRWNHSPNFEGISCKNENV